MVHLLLKKIFPRNITFKESKYVISERIVDFLNYTPFWTEMVSVCSSKVEIVLIDLPLNTQ